MLIKFIFSGDFKLEFLSAVTFHVTEKYFLCQNWIWSCVLLISFRIN